MPPLFRIFSAILFLGVITLHGAMELTALTASLYLRAQDGERVGVLHSLFVNGAPHGCCRGNEVCHCNHTERPADPFGVWKSERCGPPMLLLGLAVPASAQFVFLGAPGLGLVSEEEFTLLIRRDAKFPSVITHIQAPNAPPPRSI